MKQVTVTTVPNGYVLKVDKQEYMTFNEQELSAAVFYHVTLGVEKEVNKDISDNLMVAAASWPTVSDAIRGNASLMARNKELAREARVSRKQLSNLNAQYEALQSDFQELKQKYANVLIKADQYEDEKKKADTAYELYGKECRRVAKLEGMVAELNKMLANRKRTADAKRRKRTREEILEDNLADQSEAKPKKKATKPKKPKKQPTTPPDEKKPVKRKTQRNKAADEMVLRELERQAREKGDIL